MHGETLKKEQKYFDINSDQGMNMKRVSANWY